jgi:hypothetical protein
MEQRAAPASPSQTEMDRTSRPPRWLVVSGLILYCSVFWMLIWAAGSFGIDLIRTATAGAP